MFFVVLLLLQSFDTVFAASCDYSLLAPILDARFQLAFNCSGATASLVEGVGLRLTCASAAEGEGFSYISVSSVTGLGASLRGGVRVESAPTDVLLSAYFSALDNSNGALLPLAGGVVMDGGAINALMLTAADPVVAPITSAPPTNVTFQGDITSINHSATTTVVGAPPPAFMTTTVGTLASKTVKLGFFYTFLASRNVPFTVYLQYISLTSSLAVDFSQVTCPLPVTTTVAAPTTVPTTAASSATSKNAETTTTGVPDTTNTEEATGTNQKTTNQDTTDNASDANETTNNSYPVATSVDATTDGSTQKTDASRFQFSFLVLGVALWIHQ